MRAKGLLVGSIGAGVLTVAFCLFVGEAAFAAEPSSGRWCTLISATDPNRAAAPQGVQCDGYSEYGQLHKFATLKSVSILIPRTEKTKERRVTIPYPGLSGQDIASATVGKPDAVKRALDRYLESGNLPPVRGSSFTVDAIELEHDEPIYSDYEAREKRKLDPSLLEAGFVIDQKKLFANEMLCLSGLKKFPGLEPDLTMDPGDKTHQPLLVLQAQNYGQGKADYFFTPEGFYLNEYDGKQPDRQGRHYVEVPGSKEFPSARWIYHEYVEHSRIGGLASWSTPFVLNRAMEEPPLPAKKLEAITLQRDPADDAVKALHKKLIAGTRKFRDVFDKGNPRFHSPFTLKLVSNAIDKCKAIPGLHPEIEYFENHVFPERNRLNPGETQPHVRPSFAPMLASPMHAFPKIGN